MKTYTDPNESPLLQNFNAGDLLSKQQNLPTVSAQILNIYRDKV